MKQEMGEGDVLYKAGYNPAFILQKTINVLNL